MTFQNLLNVSKLIFHCIFEFRTLPNGGIRDRVKLFPFFERMMTEKGYSVYDLYIIYKQGNTRGQQKTQHSLVNKKKTLWKQLWLFKIMLDSIRRFRSRFEIRNSVCCFYVNIYGKHQLTIGEYPLTVLIVQQARVCTCVCDTFWQHRACRPP